MYRVSCQLRGDEYFVEFAVDWAVVEDKKLRFYFKQYIIMHITPTFKNTFQRQIRWGQRSVYGHHTEEVAMTTEGTDPIAGVQGMSVKWHVQFSQWTKKLQIDFNRKHADVPEANLSD